LVEDVAHAPGAVFDGRICGTFGDVSCFSFFSNKNLSVGEGGMFVTSNARLFEKGKLIRSHGMSSLTLDRHKGRAISYDVLDAGLNFRIDEMRSALGLVQLQKLSENNSNRVSLTKRYREKLGDLSVVIPFEGYVLENSVCHIMPVLLPENINRSDVIQKLKEDGIQTSIHYPSFRQMSAYSSIKGCSEVADSISARELTLPLFPTMSFEQVEYVCNSLKKALK
jgi:dTDP-4-amino-4,6-dideoxygalactose transaminase